MTGMARLPPSVSNQARALSPLFLQFFQGWTLPLSVPCLGQHHVLQDFFLSGHSKQAGATPKHVGLPCLPALSPKTMPHESQAQEREKENEKEGSERQVHDMGVATGSQD